MKFEDYKAPWEIADGVDVAEDQQVIDKDKLKKYLHGLLSDKDRLQVTVTSVTTERDTAKSDLAAKLREGEDDQGKAKRERQEAVDAARAEGTLPALKLEVALEVEGITPKQAAKLAKRLTGKDRPELEADAKLLVEDFGIGKTADAVDGDELDQGPAGRPKRSAAASRDPRPNDQDGPDANDPATLNRLFPRF